MDGRSAKLFARQNGSDVTQCDFHLNSCVGSYDSDFNSFSKTNLPHTIVCPRQTEPPSTRLRVAMDTNHSPDSSSASATDLNFPGETLNKVELKHFLESFQDAMDQKPYGAMLRGELPYAALQLAPQNLDDIPPIADTSTGPDATRAALRAHVEHENKLKQESKEALVRDYSSRIASFLATSMRPRAGLKLRKIQDTHALPLYPSMYDGVQ
eukprot:3063023-Pleurochrysis_carterae.AAC.3